MATWSLSSVASEEMDSSPMNAMPSFEEVDADGDGQISLSELDAFRATTPMQQGSAPGKQMNRRDSVSAFASFDTNKDGVISLEEFEAHSRYSNPGSGTGMMNKEMKTNRSSNQSQKQNMNGGKGKSY